MKKTIVITVILAILNMSCGKSESNKNPIISTDFQDMEFKGEPVFVAMVKLKEPALLSTAVRSEEGVYSVDDNLKSKILAEQADLAQRLKRISPEIKVIYSYKMVLNALALEAPQKFADEISNLEVDFIEADERFALPTAFEKQQSVQTLKNKLSEKNSMTFVGVDKIHKRLKAKNKNGELVSVLGQGVKVGVIDTGIDYTHKMLGGSGDVATYESIDANKDTEHFPNLKVVGGKDFVGEAYSPGNHIYQSRIPKPDNNPLDKGGHGTHVAGTVAGLGDGINTYSGAAPGADLYALKVFGDNGGGTSDTVVIAALEYAADPNGDLNPDDKLDVVNLSLGGGFGKPHNLYSVAIENLTKGGILAVASAGNSGPVSNIVGAPSTAASALSVAASVDDLPQNIEFNAASFNSENLKDLLVEALEGAITKPLDQVTSLSGELFYIGTAEVDLDEEQKKLLKGKIALIDRGGVSFSDKISRALNGGAIAVVVANNQAGSAIVMGGDGQFDIPGVMVTQAVGDKIKEELKSFPVTADLVTEKKIQKTELIDTLAGFSSQGPRDLDALIKPEISAPGQAVISASVGSGDQGVMLGGTSMSSPHIAGIAALLVQYRKNLKPEQIKAILMNTSKLISDEQNVLYPISRQGAGRVQAFKAARAEVLFSKPSISLGKVAVDSSLDKVEVLTLTNISERSQTFSIEAENGDNLKIKASPALVELLPGESVEIELTVTLTPSNLSEVIEEDAFVVVKSDAKTVGRIPVLAVINRNSQISPVALNVEEGSGLGSKAEAFFLNESQHDGVVLLFNLLGEDKRKADSKDKSLSFACDLESAGYRVVTREGVPHLQIATKIYNPVSSWEACDLSVDLDLNADGLADKTVYGSNPTGFPGLADNQGLAGLGLSTLVFDSNKLSELLLQNEKSIAEQNETAPVLDFLPALEAVSSMLAVKHSTLAVADISLAGYEKFESLQVKVSVSFNGGDVQERDDVLSDIDSIWKRVELKDGAGYTGLPEELVVKAGSIGSAAFKKGRNAQEKLIAYFPRNEFNLLRQGRGKQASIMEEQLDPENPLP